MKKRSSIIIISLVVFIMGFAGFSMFAFGDTSNYDPDKEYRCPGVCKIQQIFGIEDD